MQAALGHAALEALDATAAVDELLAARVERVAVRADLDAQLVLSRAGDELVAARAVHVCSCVRRVDLRLHRLLILAAWARPVTRARGRRHTRRAFPSSVAR